MGNRFFNFCKNGPQILWKCPKNPSYGFLEPFAGKKKKKKIWPEIIIFYPRPRENVLKNKKMTKNDHFWTKNYTFCTLEHYFWLCFYTLSPAKCWKWHVKILFRLQNWVFIDGWCPNSANNSQFWPF